jgi:hypothetical protein
MAENESPDEREPDRPTSTELPASSRILSPPKRPGRGFLVVALMFEASLGVAGLIGGWLFGLTFESMRIVPSENATAWVTDVAWGFAAAVPMFGGLVLLDQRPPAALRRFRDEVARKVLPLFRPMGIGQLALISTAAGVGEEILFRGLIQFGLHTAIGGPFGLVIGLLVASTMFGVCHLLNLTYAILAALVGVYLGLLVLMTDNLLTPIVTHAAYDFAALVYLTRRPE